MQKLEEEKRSREVPLRYAFVWAKFVGKLTGAGGWGVAIADKMEAARKRREHEMSIEWVKDLSAQEDPPVSAPSSSAPAGTAVSDVVSAAMSGGRPGGDRRSRESKSKLKWVRAGDTVADSLSGAEAARTRTRAGAVKGGGRKDDGGRIQAEELWRHEDLGEHGREPKVARSDARKAAGACGDVTAIRRGQPDGGGGEEGKGVEESECVAVEDHSEGKALPPDLAQAAENNIGALRRGTSVGLVAEFD